MSVNLSLFAGAGWQFFDNNGVPLAGGLIYTYAAGTTTPEAAYTSNTGVTAHANPIVLNSAGRVAVGEVWVSEGVSYKFVLKDSTGTTIGTYDNINGTYVAADLANTTDPALGDALVGFRQSNLSGNLSGAVGRTVHSKLQESISILDFIPPAEVAAIQAGTSTYDCYSAIVSAINAAILGTGAFYRNNPAVKFPYGIYNCSATIQLTMQVKLYGDGSGLGYSDCPTIKFTTAGGTGIYILPFDVGFSGAGCIIEGLRIFGTLGTADALGGHGISMRQMMQVRNSQVTNFAGNGVNIVADVSGSGITLGNANGWSLRDVIVWECQNGVYVQGGDSNAGIGHGVNVLSARNRGIWDSSFLGNTWIGCEVATTTGAAYVADNANARSVFLGCYSEGDCAPSSFISPSMVIGGLQGAGLTGPYFYTDTANGGFISNVGLSTGTYTMGYLQSATSGVGLSYLDTKNALPWTFSKTTGRWGYQWAGLGTQQYIQWYDGNATPANGYARDISSVNAPSGANAALGISGHYSGNYTQMLWRDLGTAAPTSGAYLQGDIIYNSAPTAGGFIGFVCVTAGNPGTWKTFGAISA